MSDRMTTPESLPTSAEQLQREWRIAYIEDMDFINGGHFDRWAVTDGVRSFKCDSKGEAQWLLAALSARQVQPEHPMACWSVDVHDDEDGRTWINIRNPDDDVACLSVKTMVRRGQRSIAASVLYEFHAAWQAMHCQPAQAAQAALDDVRVAVRAAVLAEREACALASERQIDRWVDDRARYAASECAAAIRARTDAAMLSASPAAGQEGGE